MLCCAELVVCVCVIRDGASKKLENHFSLEVEVGIMYIPCMDCILVGVGLLLIVLEWASIVWFCSRLICTSLCVYIRTMWYEKIAIKTQFSHNWFSVKTSA